MSGRSATLQRARKLSGGPTVAAALGVLLAWNATGCGSSTSSALCDEAVAGEACYASNRDPSSQQVALATEIAIRYIDEHPVQQEFWDWRAGVLMFALTELHRVTGDARLRDYYQRWLDFHIDRGYQILVSDNCPPALAAISLLSETSNDAYQQVVDDVLLYLTDLAPRVEGGISHLGLIGVESLWVDSLFMFGMVLTRWGELSGETRYLDLFSEQLDIFASRMQDESGLLVHAYGWPGEIDTDIFWARGNSWVTASTADYLRVRVLANQTDPRAEQIFADQLEGILQTQDSESGMWWTLMNRQGEIYLETSATALFSYAIARAYRYGIVGDEELGAALRAVAGVKEAIVEDEDGRPVVTGISGPTDLGNYDFYASVPLQEDISYGVGAAILSLVETSGL